MGGSWKVLARLGGGSFGTVYRAAHVVLPEHEVALKLLEAPCTTDFARQKALHEVRLLASVSSPYVVQVKEWGWHEDRLYFTMPLYRGGTLAEESTLKGHSSLADRRREARRIFGPLAHGLAALHRAGLVHQDIKPENIYLAEVEGSTERFPILLDLGVARRVDHAMLAGTPRYCAPEAARRFLGADVPVGPAADVYGLALSLLEWLCPEAVPPTENVAAHELLMRRVGDARAQGEPAWRMNAVPKDLRPWFARWLSADPDKRPDAATFAGELSALTRPEELRAKARWAATRVGVPAAVTVMALVMALFNMDLHARAIAAEEHIEHMNRVAEEQDHARDHQELSAVNGMLHGRLDDAVRTQSETATERERLRNQRDQARTERAQYRVERDAVQVERENLQNQRNAIQTDRDRVMGERDVLQGERDRLITERNTLQTERDRLTSERNAAQADRDRVMAQRDSLAGERERLVAERGELTAQRDEMRAQRDQLRSEMARRMAAVQPQMQQQVVYPGYGYGGQPRL